MGTSVAFCHLGYHTAPTPAPTPPFPSSTSRSSGNSIVRGLQKRQATAWNRKPKCAVTGMPTVLFPSLVHGLYQVCHLPTTKLGNSLQDSNRNGITAWGPKLEYFIKIPRFETQRAISDTNPYCQ